ncbi:MAG: mobile mystery protein B [Saprospiraceae bacterium]|nr:mobile mystery protein B [Saprospiraceae bacterium]
MGLKFEHPDGQTPLYEEEKDGLLIPTIATRGELDEFEQQNIEQAVQWVLMKTFKPDVVFTEKFIRDVHKRMYGNIWAWAGDFRRSNKNLGVDKWQISIELKKLLEDAIFWMDNKTYSPDEFAIRFKHKLVSIHCFPNGNGRHSRLLADIIIGKLFKLQVFSWGASHLDPASNSRATYINALKKADNGEIVPLLEFARS